MRQCIDQIVTSEIELLSLETDLKDTNKVNIARSDVVKTMEEETKQIKTVLNENQDTLKELMKWQLELKTTKESLCTVGKQFLTVSSLY